MNARGDGDKVVINVTDTGIGVSPDDAAHIFQKFYRVDNSQTRQIGGTGLGLYLVKQRVEAMNGRVWVESAFGDGSTFFVSLPRLTDAEYQKQKLAYDNERAVKAFAEGKNVATSAMIQPTAVKQVQGATVAQTPMTSQGAVTAPQANVTPAQALQQAQMPTATTIPTAPTPPANPAMAAVPKEATPVAEPTPTIETATTTPEVAPESMSQVTPQAETQQAGVPQAGTQQADAGVTMVQPNVANNSVPLNNQKESI